MRLITYSPITRPTTIFNELDRWLSNITTELPSMWKPRFEVLDMDTAYRVRAELPGMDKKDVNIEVDNDVLTISGERKYDKDSDKKDYSELVSMKFNNV